MLIFCINNQHHLKGGWHAAHIDMARADQAQIRQPKFIRLEFEYEPIE